jgi:3-deoxy-D-manno-octulosonate 8-phosphate phosphatase KdsC-like HAD superfamily phosphatase
MKPTAVVNGRAARALRPKSRRLSLLIADVDGGFSIAMRNASAEVQSQADAVTASCNDDGFAKTVERYLLGQEPPSAGGDA